MLGLHVMAVGFELEADSGALSGPQANHHGQTSIAAAGMRGVHDENGIELGEPGLSPDRRSRARDEHKGARDQGENALERLHKNEVTPPGEVVKPAHQFVRGLGISQMCASYRLWPRFPIGSAVTVLTLSSQERRTYRLSPSATTS